MLTVFLRNYKLKPFEYDATSLTRLFLGSFSHFSLQSLSSSIKLDVHSHFLISPEIFTWAQVWALAAPLRDIHRVVPKPSRLSARMSLCIIVYIFPLTLTVDHNILLD